MNITERIIAAWIAQVERLESVIVSDCCWNWWMGELERRLASVEGSTEYDGVRLGLRGAGYYDK